MATKKLAPWYLEWYQSWPIFLRKRYFEFESTLTKYRFVFASVVNQKALATNTQKMFYVSFPGVE
jgi:hypothetical protein